MEFLCKALLDLSSLDCRHFPLHYSPELERAIVFFFSVYDQLSSFSVNPTRHGHRSSSSMRLIASPHRVWSLSRNLELLPFAVSPCAMSFSLELFLLRHV